MEEGRREAELGGGGLGLEPVPEQERGCLPSAPSPRTCVSISEGGSERKLCVPGGFVWCVPLSLSSVCVVCTQVAVEQRSCVSLVHTEGGCVVIWHNSVTQFS